MTSSNSAVATASVSGTKVTVTPGTTAGTATITVTSAATTNYKAASATYKVTVEKTLKSIAVTTQPTTTNYYPYEDFKTDGMVVTATYTDNSTKTVSGYTVTDGSDLKMNQNSVTVSYTDAEFGGTKTTTVSISIYDPTNSWDVSANGDGSVMAYYSTGVESNYNSGLLVVTGQGQMKNYDGSLGKSPMKSIYAYKIVVEDGVTSIGNYAFWDAFVMEISLPETLKTIGEYSFCDCDNLRSVTLPDSVTTVGSMAFYGLDYGNLVYFDFGRGVSSIGNNVIYTGNYNIETVIVDCKVTSISYSQIPASRIEKLILGTSIKSIPYLWEDFGEEDYEIYPSTVYYTGTKAQWDAIDISDWYYNEGFCSVVYNYKYTPKTAQSTAED